MFLNAARGHKICTLLHEWLARSAKMYEGTILKNMWKKYSFIYLS